MEENKSILLQGYKWETNKELEEPIKIYVHGLTDKNETVSVRILNFEPHLYIELPDNLSKQKIGVLKRKFESAVKLRQKEDDVNWRGIKYMEKEKVYYYKMTKVLYIPCKTLGGIYFVKSYFGQKININGKEYKCKVHEEKASPELKLFAKTGIRPSEWIEILPTTDKMMLYQRDTEFSTSKVNVTCEWKDIKARPDIKKVINPMILSYDIECVSDDPTGETFPKPSKVGNPIIVISATIGRLQDSQDKWKTFALVNEEGNRTCRPTVQKGTVIIKCKNEKELLKKWSMFIIEIDPEVILTYNGLSFDDNYVVQRALFYGIWDQIKKCGRLKFVHTTVTEMKWQSNAYGDQDFKFMDIPGRLHMDMFGVIRKTFNGLSSYKLDAVSKEFLGEHKIDLPAPTLIRKYYENTPEAMEEIVKYCNKDTILPFMLFQKLNTWFAFIEMSNVVYVNITNLLIRGQSIKAYSQIYCLAHKMGLIVSSPNTDYRVNVEEKEHEYVGATVQTPKVGYWNNVLAYDFKSLYPTTMIAYNLCFSSYIPNSIKDNELDKETYNIFEYEEHQGCEHDTTIRKTKPNKIICKKQRCRFYKGNVKKGVVPQLLEFLLEARSKTRKELAKIEKQAEEETDLAQKKELELYCHLLDNRQLQYKMSANSVYGFLGSVYSPLPFYPVAATTTALGRLNIQRSIEFMKDKFPGTITVYGDTDSCFMHIPQFKNPNEAYKGGEELEKDINSIFPKPMYLELEKVYSDLFLLTKKRYVGYIVNDKGKLISVDKKGLVIKRRDNCGFVKRVYKNIIDFVMQGESRTKLFEYLARNLKELFMGNVPLDELKINSSLNGKYKSNGEYISFQDFIHERVDISKIVNKPQTSLALKMHKRGNYIQAGDRIDYIFIETEGKKAFEKVEDPDYFMKHKKTLKIDYMFYLKHKVQSPIDELIEVRYGIKDCIKTLALLLEKGKLEPTELDRYFITGKSKITIIE